MLFCMNEQLMLVRGATSSVVRRSELVQRGYADDEIGAMVRRAELLRLAPGVYCRPGTSGDHHEAALNRYVRRVVGRALTVPSGVVSHLSAVALHGITTGRAPLETVHMTFPGRGGSRRLPGAWQHAGQLDTDEIVAVDPLRLTSVARTLLDVARTESTENAVAMTDSALHHKRVTIEQLAAAAQSATRRPGMRRARRALRLVDGRSESVGESETRLAMRAIGLPTPEMQVEVYSARDRFLGRCDFGYLEHAVLIEFDGKTKYCRDRRPGESASDVVLREKAREDSLRAAGFIVVRVAWADLHQPDQLAQRIQDAIAIGRRAVAGGLVTGRGVPAAPVRVCA